MSTNTTVRQAVSSDLDHLARLFDEYRQFQKQHGDVAAARAFLRDRIDRGESVLFIAVDRDEDKDHAVGFAQLYPSFSSVSLARIFVLNDLFVSPTGRGQGVATLLLGAVESHAWALGCARVTLNVAKDNVLAQRLYQARGWTRDEQFDMFHRFPPSPTTAAA